MIARRWAWFLLAAGTASAPATAATSLRVTFDGRAVTTNAPLARSAAGLLVPLRPVSRVLGGQTSWDDATKTAVVQYRGRSLEVDEQRHEIRLDGQSMGGASPRKAQGQLLIPLTAVERLFGVQGRLQARQHLLSFAATGREPEPAARGNAKQPPAVSGLAMRLSSDRKTYAAGAPVRFTLSVINEGRAPVAMQFSSGQKYDIEVRRGGQPVWHWAADRMFTQVLTSLTLSPGERKSFSETWKQQDDSGRPAPAGEYEAIATLATTTRPRPQTPPITLQIGS